MDKNYIQALAESCRLSLDEKDVNAMREDFDNILQWTKTISEANVGTELQENPMEDHTLISMPVVDADPLAPKENYENDLYLVPKVME